MQTTGESAGAAPDRSDAGSGRTHQARRGEPRRDIIKTWSFDSAGTKKYALQIQRASNGNPCLRIVEGTPQEDGSYRKFGLTIWSEDFQSLFSTLNEVHQYMQDNDIRTPDGHKWTPQSSRRGRSRR